MTTNTVVVRFNFSNAESFGTRYTAESFERNNPLLSHWARAGVVTIEPDTGQTDVIDTTRTDERLTVFTPVR